jgi:hypothetical protein
MVKSSGISKAPKGEPGLVGGHGWIVQRWDSSAPMILHGRVDSVELDLRFDRVNSVIREENQLFFVARRSYLA